MKNTKIYLQNQGLSKLIIALSLSTLLIGCNKVDNNISGKWYAPNFGVITISDTAIKFFPFNVNPETWSKVEGKNKFRYKGIYFSDCERRHSTDLFVSVKKIDSQTIRLTSNDSCLLKVPFTDNLILHRMPNKLKLDFDYISVIQYRDDKLKEVRLTPKDFKLIDSSYDDFSLEERLWILFSSGVVDNNYRVNRFDATTISLSGNGFGGERRIPSAYISKYIKDIINKVESN